MTLQDEIAAQLSACSQTPRLDALYFCDFYHQNPTQGQVADFIRRRKAGEPVAKIIGRKGFWKREFIVTKDVLDPRPDSETLIETVLRRFPDQSRALRLSDIGTGSGCLLLTLLDEYPNATGEGVDVSEKALAVARQNDQTNGRVRWIQADLFAPDFAQSLETYDVVISNPPYIPTTEIDRLEPSVRCYDPMLALDGGADGLNAYRRLAAICGKLLNAEGTLIVEIGQGQETAVTDLMRAQGFVCREQVRDLGGIVRVLVFQEKGTQKK